MQVGCGVPHAPAPGAVRPSIARLESYGPLFTTKVEVGGETRTFLVDTGGGMTVLVPELAVAAGCTAGAPLTGFRMSGERIDAPRCEGATLSVAGWRSPPHTVLLLDINTMLPPDWPRLDGLLSLATFDKHIVTVDLGRGVFIIDDIQPAAQPARIRIERSVTGLALGVFVASRHGNRDYWFEVDTGSNGAVILNAAVAKDIAAGAADASGRMPIELRLDAGSPIATTAVARDLRFDGNLGLETLGTWSITIDLANEKAWFQRPPVAR
jgi:hypothetical protein